jgi:hypothetical protein
MCKIITLETGAAVFDECVQDLLHQAMSYVLAIARQSKGTHHHASVLLVCIAMLELLADSTGSLCRPFGEEN